jgi:DNA repair exonuclease SbcCD ATPase subunit
MPEQASLQGESVERIRDIIFGPKMRDYEQRFDALVRDVGRLQEELDRLAEQMTAKDAGQSKNLQAVRQELRQANGELHSELKNEAARLTTQMAEQHAAHTNALNATRQELNLADDNLQTAFKADIEQVNCAMSDHEAAQKTTLQSLRQELRKADADIREELRQVMQRLTDDKTDRSTLGELFVELGNHIKSGGNLADLLQGLDQPG